MQSKAELIQEHIEGICLPGGESEFYGRSFVVLPGWQDDLLAALLEAFGIKFDAKAGAKLEKTNFCDDFSGARGFPGVRGCKSELRERLKRATEILKSFGETYQLNFEDTIMCAPVLNFAQGEDKAILGVITCRVWT